MNTTLPRPTCTHMLGALPCANPAPHTGGGKGCVHHATWAPDRSLRELPYAG